MNNDTHYVRVEAKRRLGVKVDRLGDEDLPLECLSIRARHYFPPKPLSDEESAYPIAQARIVYTDYLLLEMELAVAYQPQNWYCYAIDSKADRKFHARVRALASCFPNVLVTQREYRVDSRGHNTGPSHLECLKLLLQPQRRWQYVSLLQNHDITLKTNRETVRILKLLDGANDVETSRLPRGRIDKSLDWSFAALSLFRNASKNGMAVTPNGYPSRLEFAKGYVESSLRREMVDFMLNELDLTELMRRLEKGRFGVDEILISTLHASDTLQVPGGFTHLCVERKTRARHITRKSKWSAAFKCLSHRARHGICLIGLEDVAFEVRQLPHLFINKIMPDFDFGATVCWYEWMFNRTHATSTPPAQSYELDEDFYRKLPHVRFQQFKREYLSSADPSQYRARLESFDCSCIKYDGK